MTSDRRARQRLAAVFYAALVVLCSVAASASAGPGGTRQVITQDMIRAAGVVRLTDILFLADDWLLHTTNGYTYKASPYGLAAWDQQRWVVLIDGQRADVDLFDAVNLNTVPIGAGQIDSVVIDSAPALDDGVFADAGLVHLYTRRPPPGKTAALTASGGNETGDQGPYRFTPYRSPNIDSVGPDGSLTFTFARDNWAIRADATLQTYYFTDPAVRRRVNALIGLHSAVPVFATDETFAATQAEASDAVDVGTYAAYPDMRRITGSLGMRFDGAHGELETFLGYAEAFNYFLYSEAVGREVPMDNRYTHAGANGAVELGSAGGLLYRAQFTDNRMAKRENTLDIDYGWSRRRFLADGECFCRYGGARFAVGGGYEMRSIDTSYPLENNPSHFGKLCGSVEIEPMTRMSHELDATAFFAGGEPTLKAAWKGALRVTDRHALQTLAAYTQRSFAENGDLWYWTDRGYGFLADNGITAALPNEINGSNAFIGDVAWRARLPAGITLRLSGRYCRHSEAYLEYRSFEYDTDHCSVWSPTLIVPGNDGELAGGTAGLCYRHSSRVEARVHYRYLATLSGDDLFEDKWRTVPDHKVSVRVTYRPVGGFTMWAMLTHYSSAFWKEYEALENAPCEWMGCVSTYSPRIDAFTTVDVALRKLLWRERLAVDLAVRNLFGEEVRYHPVGASFGLGVFMQLSLELHGR